MRKFDTGATRNDDSNQYDYEGFLSPIVLQRFAKYMHGHREQADGQLRASDNWQNLFGDNHLDVCIKSLVRHTVDLWLIHDGYTEQSRAEDAEEALCAILFNTQAYLYGLLKDKK